MSSTPSAHTGVTPKSQSQSLPIDAGSRPYRSHKIRACDLCRKRKSRCTVDLPGQSCVLCRIQGSDCHYQEDQVQSTSSAPAEPEESQWSLQHETPSTRKRKRGQEKRITPIGDSAERFHEAEEYRQSPARLAGDLNGGRKSRGLGESLNESVHVVGPVAAEDAQVIERHMPPERSTKTADAKTPYNVYSNDPRKPVLYTTVSRRRQGVRATDTPGTNQKEILEQILGPFKHDLVKIYLERINAAFPIFDEDAFMESYRSENGDLPPPLICQVYAISLVYWNQYPALAQHPKPDIRYAVNLAVAALHEEFSAPGLSTLSASLIDLTGRQIFSMTGNALNGGRTVALSHCLGLNRDPGTWKLSPQEKNHRIRLWWGVTIHDRWASFAHGVPPQIGKCQYDVPLPGLDVLVTQTNTNQYRVRAAHGYIALCRLTEILGELLPLVYDLHPKSQKDTSKRLRRTQTKLDAWEDSLPDWLQSPSQGSGPVSGASSLQLGFLALKMLVCRVELHEVNHSEAPDNSEARLYFQAKCRKSAQEIVHFMTSLKKRHFQEFWMSYSAYHLTSTATLLVRCAFETTDTAIARSCLSSVNVLQDVLRRAKEEDDWELADMCLDHCQRILSKHPGTAPDEQHQGVSYETLDAAAAAMTLPESLTHNDIVDDMMSVSGGFGTMDGFPFDMTGIWDISGFHGDGLNQ